MVRSPWASMKIADNAVGSPSTRWQNVQSTFSRLSAASTRSPLESSPPGPPSGPASDARPPSRAIATAALAAQPPLTTKKSVACTLPSGFGNSSTRNTSSSTMMPVQRMRGGLADDTAAILDEAADEMMRDGDRRRCRQAVAMAAAEHRRQLVAMKPARILDLAAVDDDGLRQRLGVAADHQRARERPRLRHEIVDASAADPGFLQHFAPHRFLYCFARLGKTGERRPHGRHKARRTAEYAALARDRQHDHHRIGAREMLDFAGRAIAPPAGLHDRGRRAAIGTEAVARALPSAAASAGENSGSMAAPRAFITTSSPPIT